MRDLIGGDRRTSRRYELALNLRFSYVKKGAAIHGNGTTVELASGGVLFHADAPPPDGVEVELRVEWPFLLQEVCNLEVLLKGRVIRTDSRGTAVKMHGYEFQTCGPRSFAEAPAPRLFLVA